MASGIDGVFPFLKYLKGEQKKHCEISFTAWAEKYEKLSQANVGSCEVDLVDFSIHNDDDGYVEQMEPREFAFATSYRMPMPNRKQLRKIQKGFSIKKKEKFSKNKVRSKALNPSKASRNKNGTRLTSCIGSGSCDKNIEKNSPNVTKGPITRLAAKSDRQSKKQLNSKMDDSLFSKTKYARKAVRGELGETNSKSLKKVNEAIDFHSSHGDKTNVSSESQFKDIVKSPKQPQLIKSLADSNLLKKQSINTESDSVLKNSPNDMSDRKINHSISGSASFRPSIGAECFFGDSESNPSLKNTDNDMSVKKVIDTTPKRTRFDTSIDHLVGDNVNNVILKGSTNNVSDGKVNHTILKETRFRKASVVEHKVNDAESDLVSKNLINVMSEREKSHSISERTIISTSTVTECLVGDIERYTVSKNLDNNVSKRKINRTTPKQTSSLIGDEPLISKDPCIQTKKRTRSNSDSLESSKRSPDNSCNAKINHTTPKRTSTSTGDEPLTSKDPCIQSKKRTRCDSDRLESCEKSPDNGGNAFNKELHKNGSNRNKPASKKLKLKKTSLKRNTSIDFLCSPIVLRGVERFFCSTPKVQSPLTAMNLSPRYKLNAVEEDDLTSTSFEIQA